MALSHFFPSADVGIVLPVNIQTSLVKPSRVMSGRVLISCTILIFSAILFAFLSEYGLEKQSRSRYPGVVVLMTTAPKITIEIGIIIAQNIQKDLVTIMPLSENSKKLELNNVWCGSEEAYYTKRRRGRRTDTKIPGRKTKTVSPITRFIVRAKYVIFICCSRRPVFLSPAS